MPLKITSFYFHPFQHLTQFTGSDDNAAFKSDTTHQPAHPKPKQIQLQVNGVIYSLPRTTTTTTTHTHTHTHTHTYTHTHTHTHTHNQLCFLEMYRSDFSIVCTEYSMQRPEKFMPGLHAARPTCRRKWWWCIYTQSTSAGRPFFIHHTTELLACTTFTIRPPPSHRTACTGIRRWKVIIAAMLSSLQKEERKKWKRCHGCMIIRRWQFSPRRRAVRSVPVFLFMQWTQQDLQHWQDPR